MNFYGKVFSIFLFFHVMFLSIAQGQVSECGFEIISSELIVNSENEITIIADVSTNNMQADGIAYLINNNYLQSLGLDIFWSPASFSVHSNDETFQIAISGTSTSIISIPDELELSGRIAFSFNEEPIVFNDIKLLESDSALVDVNNSSLDDDTTIIILDTSVVTIDTIFTPTDTVLTPIDTIRTEVDSLVLLPDSLLLIDESEILSEDSVQLSHSTITSDSILIGNQLIFMENIPNICEINYICQLPVYDEQVANDEARIANDDIQKNENEIVDNHFGAIFDNELLEMKELSFNVFPNPTVEYFYVHSGTNKNLNVLIYSTTGNIVFEKTMDSNYAKVDIPNLPDGLYFVLLKTNTGESHLTKLLVK